ncbi:helix-turn-helix domain-containing protein [Prosthecodimorpha staleyi]|uniref:Helix-turn-helix domain-containing protein n=1 Tax=Prosthecodimorpha staleyi TaxID=2840188 RepID=A0A947D6N0_9HYPH|nr:helix-turn-helix domain-containing protein [Prosthecodimorpha staleyi]MBT9291323.1 helix-turn-helix domain-containing protein [Prosthecodimorpha staleyi]
MAIRRWDKHAIKAEVHRRGATLVGIARAAALEPSACKVALHRKHAAGERAIAGFLGISPAELWPDRYAARPASHGFNTAAEPLGASRNRPAA